jgi:hypothetical protein
MYNKQVLYQFKIHLLLDTSCSSGNFVDEKTAHELYEIEGVRPIELLCPKKVRGFDGKVSRLITYAIYPRL